jgi:hypothetical protein
MPASAVDSSTLDAVAIVCFGLVNGVHLGMYRPTNAVRKVLAKLCVVRRGRNIQTLPWKFEIKGPVFFSSFRRHKYHHSKSVPWSRPRDIRRKACQHIQLPELYYKYGGRQAHGHRVWDAKL